MVHVVEQAVNVIPCHSGSAIFIFQASTQGRVMVARHLWTRKHSVVTTNMSRMGTMLIHFFRQHYLSFEYFVIIQTYQWAGSWNSPFLTGRLRTGHESQQNVVNEGPSASKPGRLSSYEPYSNATPKNATTIRYADRNLTRKISCPDIAETISRDQMFLQSQSLQPKHHSTS